MNTISCIFQLSTSKQADKKGKDHSKACDKGSKICNIVERTHCPI